MKRFIKLTAAEQAQQQAFSQLEQQEKGREFATAEEMLRHDAQRTPVPPGIAQRLQVSLADVPAPGQSWWRRLFKI